MFKIRALFLMSLCCIVNSGCSTSPSKEEQLAQMQTEIKQLSNLPLTSFLPRYFAKQGGESHLITLQAEFAAYYDSELLKPRLILEMYCGNNNANLSRIPHQQTIWADTSPEAFSDTRTVGNAQISLDSMSQGNNPGYGAAQASRAGAFGLFECRENATDRILWKASIQGSIGTIQKTPFGITAVMPITIRAN